MNSNENNYLILLAKVLAQEASAEEKLLLEKYTKENSDYQVFADDMTKTWDLIGDFEENIPVDTDTAWTKLEDRLSISTELKNTTKIVRFSAIWKAAAVLLLAFSAVFWYNNTANHSLITKINTQKGEQKECRLPDGSLVTLNENSTLVYDNNFENRTVNLTGEAFFEVVKQDKNTFEILTSSSKTTVLGTSFNVRAYAQESTEIAVFSGRVAVEDLIDKNNRVLLAANERAVCKVNAAIEKIDNSDSNNIAWKTKELIFDNTELSVLVKTLEHYFEVEIGIENKKVLSCHFTGRFNQPQLAEIIESIAFSNNLELKKVNNKYILIGQGCE